MANIMRYRNPAVIGAGAVVAALVVLLAWIMPQGHKLSSLDTQKQQLTTQEETLQAEIVTLQHDQDQKVTNCSTLDTLEQEIPTALQEGQFVLDVGALAQAQGASTPSITWGASAPGGGVDSVGVTLAVAGTFGQVMGFVKGLDGSGFPRLFTVSSFSVGAAGGSSGGGTAATDPVVIGTAMQSPSAGNYQVALAGKIYYAPAQTDVSACTVAPAKSA